MPGFVAQRVAQALNERGKPVRGSRILGVGVTYKADVADVRESPAVAVLERLAADGARVGYHDPFVDRLEIAGREPALEAADRATLREQDCVVVLTAHGEIDFEAVVRDATSCSTRVG